MIKEVLTTLIKDSLNDLGIPKDMAEVILDHPADLQHGDYSTNIAMSLFKSLGASSKSPYELAQKIAEKIQAEAKTGHQTFIERVEVVQPGFINIYLSKEFFVSSLAEVLEKKSWYGKSTKRWNKKMIIEYTDPNAFKQFHIGHLMSNAIGESLSRILEFQDVKMTRATYGSDIGRNVAMCMWGMMKLQSEAPKEDNLDEQVAFIGKAYVHGAESFENDEKAKQEILDLNIKIYDKSDPKINELYAWGRDVSIKHFNEMYVKLGSRFDFNFWESEIAEEGRQIVEAGLQRGIFEKSEGAIIFKGELYGLHNRVFINSQGLPTYEAKELGLTKKKFEIHDFDESIVITANEQNDYFKVVLMALKYIYPEIADRTKHLSHGIMRFESGKMSSRKGNVITGESLLADIEEMILEKMKDRDMTESDKKDTASKISVAALKYSILRQSIGKDIIFDPEKSLSFEGDSGPYLQYAYIRTKSILAKAKEQGISAKVADATDVKLTELEKTLYRFPEIIERASEDYAPQYIATYLIDLAGTFNAYYAKNKIIDTEDTHSPHRVALTEAVGWILKNGLYLLGIQVPEKM
ncbi:arginine--tRNA ligase [Candidatus Parcubacteria bacterium]|nr:arginine--tRNA ligase [Candidatus Parcubacteria bacterium]